MDQVEAAALGIAAAVVAVILMNLWPSLYRWGKVITVGEGRTSGRRMYAVRFGRWSDLGRPESRFGRVLHKRILKGPVDITLHARIAIVERDDAGAAREKVAAIPVDEAWRPSVGPGVIVWLLPERCSLDSLRTFPADIRAKRAADTLTIEDLLACEGAQLRLYAFCNRRYMGTRFVRYGKRTLKDIKPGSHKKGRFESAPAGKLPRRKELPQVRTEKVIELGDIRVEVSRLIHPEEPPRGRQRHTTP
jgi:hypothetical protein